jgi:hypothetical protein
VETIDANGSRYLLAQPRSVTRKLSPQVRKLVRFSQNDIVLNKDITGSITGST